MRIAIACLALILASPAYSEPPSPEAQKQIVEDMVAVQHFILLTSTHAFNGDAHHLRTSLIEMGGLLEHVSSLAQGELGDSKIEVAEGLTITVREYVRRILAFAVIPDVA